MNILALKPFWDDGKGLRGDPIIQKQVVNELDFPRAKIEVRQEPPIVLGTPSGQHVYGGTGGITSRFAIYNYQGKAAVGPGTVMYAPTMDVTAALDIETFGDTGATAVFIGDKIWIHFDTSGGLSGGSIEFGSPSWWSESVEIDTTTTPDAPFQTAFNLLLAEVVATNDPRPGIIIGTGGAAVKVIQLCRDDQIVTLRVVGGVVCLVPEPWIEAAAP